MSYDLRVWSSARPQLPECLPPGSWSEYDASWTSGGRGWQVVVREPLAVEMEDIPDQVYRSLPGLAFLTEIHLEPSAAPDTARKFAARVATAIARDAHGAVLDEQEETLTLPRGVKRYRTEPGTSVELLTLSWWWTGGQLDTLEGLGRFVDVLDEHVPEALPRRYGTYEPPEFKLDEHGHDHLVHFLHEKGTGLTVLYPTLPALGLSLNLQEGAGHGPHGFVAHHLQVDFDRSALAQPGWASALERFWEATSLLLEPLYGDVRTLKGYERRGSRLWVPMQAQNHPVDGPFWAGLPSGPAHALVLGDPYRALWPARNDGAGLADGLRFEAVDDWTRDDDVFELLGGPPDDLADPGDVHETGTDAPRFGAIPRYPKVWPFEK